jgi:hypothetical protein
MYTDIPSSPKTYYMRENSEKWFWITAGGLVLWFILSGTALQLYLFIFGDLSNASIIMLAVLYTLVHTAVWIMLPLAYGLNCNIKIFKGFFILFACLQVPYAVLYFLNWYGMSSVFPQLYENPIFNALVDTRLYVFDAVWALFMAVVICHRQTGGTLRLSAAAVLGSTILYELYHFKYSTWMQSLLLGYDEGTAMMSMHILNVILGGIDIAVTIVFLWALSFTRTKDTPPLEEAA